MDGWLAGFVAAELGFEARLRLDETANEVFVEGRPISLTPLELGVLAQLERADGRAVTRREVLESVWGTSFTDGSNVVDAAVHSLREKLGAEAEMVQTVRSVGYCLRA